MTAVFIIDAFADQPFEGNPAAVAPLVDLEPGEDWPADEWLQAIAAEHNLSETAFIRPTAEAGVWDLRWFTPAVEVPMCGHATLASGLVVLEHLSPDAEAAHFDTRSGRLSVVREGDALAMALPARTVAPWRAPSAVVEALGTGVVDAVHGQYATAVLADEDAVRGLTVAQGVAAARAVDVGEPGCLTVTAAGADGLDFVSRFFGPGVGIDEDPATGSTFCDLAPYWCEKLGKNEVRGFQASPRGARVTCRYLGGGQVTILAGAVEYLRGELVF